MREGLDTGAVPSDCALLKAVEICSCGRTLCPHRPSGDLDRQLVCPLWLMQVREVLLLSMITLFPFCWCLKWKLAHNPAEIQRLIEGLIVVTARAILLNPGFSPR